MKLSDRCSELYKMMENEKPNREYNGIKTWFKYEEQMKSITTCGRVIVEGDIMHILSVLAEMDLMKTFIERFEEILPLGCVTPFRMLVHSKLKMPFTIQDRDLIILGFGIIDNIKKTILVCCKSINEETYFDIDIPKEDNKYKRVHMNLGFFHIKYIKKNTYELSNGYNVDPKVPMIPWFLLNTFIKEVNYYMLEGIKKQIENTKNKHIYEKRINERKEFYERVAKEMSIFSN